MAAGSRQTDLVWQNNVTDQIRWKDRTLKYVCQKKNGIVEKVCRVEEAREKH